jgi:hypothetical protein
MSIAGADPGFQVRGEHLKKLRRAEGGAKVFRVFRVKNHDFTLKNLFFPMDRPCIVLTCKVYVYCLKMESFCLLS